MPLCVCACLIVRGGNACVSGVFFFRPEREVNFLVMRHFTSEIQYAKLFITCIANNCLQRGSLKVSFNFFYSWLHFSAFIFLDAAT